MTLRSPPPSSSAAGPDGCAPEQSARRDGAERGEREPDPCVSEVRRRTHCWIGERGSRAREGEGRVAARGALVIAHGLKDGHGIGVGEPEVPGDRGSIKEGKLAALRVVLQGGKQGSRGFENIARGVG